MLSRIEELRGRAGLSEELDRLPFDPRKHLEELQDQHRGDETRVEEFVGKAVGFQGAIAESERKLQAVATVEQTLSDAADRLAALSGKLDEAKHAAEEWNERCGMHARDLLSAPWGQVDRSHVSAVSVVELEARVRKYQSISKQRCDSEDSGALVTTGLVEPGQRRLVLPGTAFVLGVLLTLPSVRVDIPAPLDDIALAFGIGAVIVAIFLGRRWRFQVRTADQVRAQWSESLATLKSQEESARDEIGELIGELPIRAWLLQPPQFQPPIGTRQANGRSIEWI